MDKNTSKNLLLLTIFVIAFTYRLALMTMNIFPPGADIGLHESVIKSITSGKTNFFWNYYHMGGGLSVTNPGYHIFASFIIAMTGASDYLVQAAVASCFSALLVLCAFLVVRQVWSESAGFVVAILVTFSASDIVILSWSGYPNVIALTLIPLVFYLFLRSPKPSLRRRTSAPLHLPPVRSPPASPPSAGAASTLAPAPHRPLRTSRVRASEGPPVLYLPTGYRNPWRLNGAGVPSGCTSR